MIDHSSVGVRDYQKSKEFYQKTLAPLGYRLGMDLPEYQAAGFTQGDRQDFWIGANANATPVHVAFVANNKKEVEDFYAAGIAAGGKDNGAPGYRKDYSPGYYAAFVLDFDGSNIEAVWRDPSAK